MHVMMFGQWEVEAEAQWRGPAYAAVFAVATRAWSESLRERGESGVARRLLLKADCCGREVGLADSHMAMRPVLQVRMHSQQRARGSLADMGTWGPSALQQCMAFVSTVARTEAGSLQFRLGVKGVGATDRCCGAAAKAGSCTAWSGPRVPVISMQRRVPRTAADCWRSAAAAATAYR